MAVTKVEQLVTNASTWASANAIAANDLIIAATQGSASGTPTFSDTINSGNYTFIGQWVTPNANWQNLFYKVANAAGVPTYSATGIVVDRIGYLRWNGFVNTPAVLAGDLAHASGTGTTLDSSAFTCSRANEYALGMAFCTGTTLTVTDTQFTLQVGDGWLRLLDTVARVGPLASGTSVDMTGTLGVSSGWIAVVVGFWDAFQIAPGAGTDALIGQAPQLVSGTVLIPGLSRQVEKLREVSRAWRQRLWAQRASGLLVPA